MTPEKRPAEEGEGENQAVKKQKEDNGASSVSEEIHDESSQDSVSSDSNLVQDQGETGTSKTVISTSIKSELIYLCKIH